MVSAVCFGLKSEFSFALYISHPKPVFCLFDSDSDVNMTYVLLSIFLKYSNVTVQI